MSMGIAAFGVSSSSFSPLVFNARNSAARSSSPATGVVDQFVRSSVPGFLQAYSAPKGVLNSAAPDLTSIAGRQQAAKNYDAILKDLRTRYAEPEAMRRFDEIMRADGFERFEYSSTELPLSGSNSTAAGLANRPVEILPLEHADAIRQMPRDTTSANMVLHSSVHAGMQGDEAAVATESWAIYGAERPYSEEMQAAWQSRYKDAAQKDAGVDLDAYMAGLSDAAQRSVVSTSSDIASRVSRILQENGVELGSGEYLDFSVFVDDRGEEFLQVGGNWGMNGPQLPLGDIFGGDKEFVAAIKRRMADPPVENPFQEDGDFQDGDRSVEYSVSRRVTFRADEPSTAVMNDRLGVTGKGYTYVKKAGDYFDPEAGSYSVRAQPPMTDLFVKGQEQYMLDRSKCKAAADRTLAEALETGAPVAGTISRVDIDKTVVASAAAWEAYNDSVDWYDCATGEIIDHAGDGKHYGETPNVEREKRRIAEAEAESATGKASAPGDGAEGGEEPDSEPEPVAYLDAQDVPAGGVRRPRDFREVVAELNARYAAIETLLRPKAAMQA